MQYEETVFKSTFQEAKYHYTIPFLIFNFVPTQSINLKFVVDSPPPPTPINQSINPLLISYLKVEPVDVADHTGHDNLDLGLGRPEVLDELKDLVGAGLALADAEPPARQVLRNHLGHAGLLRHHQHLGSGHLVKDYVDLVPVQHSDITLYLILSSYN